MNEEETQIKNILKNKKFKNDSILLARLFLEEYNLIVKSDKELYLFNGKIYQLIDKFFFDKLFKQFLVKYNITEVWKMNKITEVRRALDAEDTIKQAEIDNYDDLICLNNGIYNFKEKTLISHSPNYYFTTMIEVDYDENAIDCSNYIAFLYQIFTLPDGSPDKDTIKNIIQLGGYLLYPENRMECMFICLGGGANGKGILFEVFQMFFAKKNISYMTLETMCKASFERQSIIGSRLNITTEAKGNQLDVEELKKIISSEEVEIMRKFQEPTSYKPKLKIIISSNTLPYFNDTSFGTDRRLIVFNFLNKFVIKAEYEKQPHPELKRIFLRGDKKKILTKIRKEKSSILNLFLKGLVMLEQNKWEMELSQNNKDAMVDYKIATDTFGTFILEFYKLDESDDYMGISSMDVLDHYRRWYIQNVKDRVPNFSVNLVGRRIKEIFRIDPIRHYSEDGRLSFYKIRRKNNDDNLQEVITSGTAQDIQFDGNGSKDNEDELPRTRDTEELFPNKRIS